MNSFYLNVGVYGNKILYRGIEKGKKVHKKVDFFPSLFLPSKQPTQFKTLKDEYLEKFEPGTIKDCKEFVDKYSGVQNVRIYGNTRYEYSFMSQEFPEDIEWDLSQITVGIIDIEVESEGGYADAKTPWQPIQAITLKLNDKYHVFGCGEYDNKDVMNVTYYKCDDEIDLLQRFLKFWVKNYPDIISGWYIKFFDIPYIINRITKLLGEDEAKKISPWKYYYKRSVVLMGSEQECYVISGIATLDYMELYRKFAIGGQSKESYKLDAICSDELGEKKTDYSQYGTLARLAKLNHQLFIEYNIRDVSLIAKLEDKLKLIELALTLAYDMKVNIEDVFTQVRMWTIMIYNTLMKQNIVIPIEQGDIKFADYGGAYVKDPTPGMYKWIISLDLDSLYPHLIMQYNISPDMIVEPKNYSPYMQTIISRGVSIDKLLNQEVDLKKLKEEGVTLTPNGQFFRIHKQGFLAMLMEKLYADRIKYKKLMKEAKKELEKETDPLKKIEIEKRIARYNNLQSAKKVTLNSAYGALGNKFFILYDTRQAEAITSSGQLSIRWIGNALNKYLNTIMKTSGATDYVIASDTDSVYLTLDELVRKSFGEKYETIETAKIVDFLDKFCKDYIQPFLAKSYGELAEYVNAFAQKMSMKREAIADKGIWTAKKRYILNVWDMEEVRYAKPKIKVTGLESVKSSTPSACRIKIKNAFEIIMNNDEKTLIEFINKFKGEFKKLPVEEISSPRGINGLTTYFSKDTIYTKGTPMQVRGSLIYNNFLINNGLNKSYELIKEGEKIKFIYLKEPNPFGSNVISFPGAPPKELDIATWVDHNTQFNKTFVEPLKAILDVIGWKTEKKTTLEDFFK